MLTMTASAITPASAAVMYWAETISRTRLYSPGFADTAATIRMHIPADPLLVVNFESDGRKQWMTSPNGSNHPKGLATARAS